MFVGACAGSTGGGIKVSRFVVVIKTISKEIQSYLHPKNIKKITLDGKIVEHETLRSTNVFIITYFIIFVVSMLCVSLEDYDLVTNFTAIAATLNNIGPGLELVGPAQNFSQFSDLSKIVLVFDMLAGRLELFPILLLFSPRLWLDTIKRKTARKIRKK